ncbi:MAG: zinc-ribbon domain-containing protein, partial [Polyangiales bacterium]
MDVTCERCGTEYEFDETLLSARGTSVKCTNCGHVFKVYPRAREDADRATSTWRLQRRDGAIDT